MTTVASSIPVRRSPWFRSPTFDLLLILGVPFVTWPLVLAGQAAWGAPLLNQLILLSATGHYFATFVRTYGDRDLFARWRTRLLVAPIVLLVLCVGLMVNGQQAPLMLATTGWAFWHWLAHAFGFARIYDSKVGSFRPWTAWLDRALVIVGFVGAVVLNPASTATFGKVFLDVGIQLPGEATFGIVQQVVLGAMILVGIAYLANLGTAIVRRQPWSWQKQVMHATTIGYYWFAFAWAPNVLVAYVLYELFHDIQYYAITWLTCRHRVQRPGVTDWLAWLFRPGFGAALGFVVLMSLGGGLDAFGRANLAADSRGHQIWLGVFLTAALLHYYFDGFVWKARESAIGADLGLQGGLRATVVPGLRHASLWLLFFVPLLATMAFAGGTFTARERAAALVAVAPGDFLSQTELAFELVKAGELPQAIVHYRASVAANPDFAQSRANFGNALDLAGELDAAREQYVQALRCPDRDGAHRQAHINLGVLLLLRGERKAADEHFRAGQQLGGEHPIGRMLAMASAVPATAVARREQLYTAVLQLEPNQLDAHYNLGNLQLSLGRFHDAAEHLSVVVRLAPEVVPGLVAATKAFLELGQIDDAKAMLQRALQREPQNAEALALRARLDGR